jgi:pimeloyl-ACP methyl ester carboxylesterase
MTHPLTPTTHAGLLDVPGARLHYEVRGSGPPLVLVGAPMNASAFAPLADLLASDHTVLTTDPRGINRSSVSDRKADSTPELRADDLSRLLACLDRGPASVFGSSGGAVTALALTQAHPEQVATVIAHEPPVIALLDDHDDVRLRTEDYVKTYLAGDVIGAWRKFFVSANIDLPDEAIEAMFGGERDPHAVADERFWFERELRPSTYWRPDFDALCRTPARIVVAVGEDSAGQECDLTSRALARHLDTHVTAFPGDHIGFVRDPDAFAARLREVLAASRSLWRAG